MTDSGAKPAVPTEPDLAMVAARLPRTVLFTFLVSGVVLAAVLVLINKADWWRGFAAASIVSAIAAAVAVLPVMWGLRRDLHKAAAGFMAGIGLRMAVSLGGCSLAVLVGGYPAVPTMLLMMAIYLSILAAETALMASSLWPAGKPKP